MKSEDRIAQAAEDSCVAPVAQFLAVFGVPKVEAETPGADSEDIALLANCPECDSMRQLDSQGSLRFLACRNPRSSAVDRQLAELQVSMRSGHVAG